MKKILFVLALSSITAFGQTTKKVCFLGNSYTNSNNLPQIISDLADADGNTLIDDKNTPGGYTLEGHSTNTLSLTKIAGDEWDFVVLQDQSQRPSFPWAQVNEEVFPFAEILCDSIRSANECAIPMFFNTWGRRDGDDQWDSINTFAKMNQRLHVAYDYMADEHSGILSPVGIGFEHIANDDDSPVTHSELYVGDGSHPSIYGSYLAACIFYELIFDTSVQGNTFSPGALTSEVTEYIQNVAHHVIHEVDSVTVNYTNPEASYTVSYSGTTATFTNTSEHAFSYFWEFGDGETSTEENPVHTYPDAGDYEATLTAIYCGREDEATGASYASITESEGILFSIYPNPSENGTIFIKYKGESTLLSVYSMDGQIKDQIPISSDTQLYLTTGTYILRINDKIQRVIIL